MLMSKGTLKRTMDEASLPPEVSLLKKYQESSSPENEMNLNIQSQASLSDKLLKISVDKCACCIEPWDGDGVKGQALQCDLCDGWFHALCATNSISPFLHWLSLYQICCTFAIITSVTYDSNISWRICKVISRYVWKACWINWECTSKGWQLVLSFYSNRLATLENVLKRLAQK